MTQKNNATKDIISSWVLMTSDHAGYDLKQSLADWLQNNGYGVELFGAQSIDASDYPDDAAKLSDALLNHQDKTTMAIAICGSGIGMAIALNRYSHIRAALCHDIEDAKLSRKHNNANVLVLAARKTSIAMVKDIIKTFQETDFDNKAERHVRRVNKLK
ncbi:MAG: RpiB/LacA/LacB family sugar-phosphate isomerase [Alphaproteobacteria bacterium]